MLQSPLLLNFVVSIVDRCYNFILIYMTKAVVLNLPNAVTL